ncbi:hypothetical protein [Rhodococcus sp. USK13]|uniref:hypothetical protein n=1 Tax=Rhodococcus sp. USK13 TaxID=2806442 RepID=UPI001BCE612F|nr:hypothetical protein [Rhodococcus sp. USK13]
MIIDDLTTRRILIAADDAGHPILVDSRLARGFDLTPTVYCEEIWETPSVADLSDSADRAPITVAFPQPGQVIARILELGPASTDNVTSMQETVEELAGSGATKGDLHRTQTTDYFAVVSGDITLKADGEEVRLTAGDFAVCLGALHGWECHTSSHSRFLAVLTGAHDYGDNGSKPVEFTTLPVAGQPCARRVVLGHDPQGRSRILDDQSVPLPARLWETHEDVPSNRLLQDPLTTNVDGRPLSDGQGFECFSLEAGHSRPLSALDHQLIGIVVQGQVTLEVNGSQERTTLAVGDIFVSNGFNVVLENSIEGLALVGVVTLPGKRP